MTDELDTGTADELPSETSDGAEAAAVEAAVSGGVRSVSGEAFAQRKWKSAAAMKRSRVWKKEIAPLFSQEGQEALAQQIADRLASRYAEVKRDPDETLEAKLPGDRSHFNAYRRSANVVPLQRGFQVPLVDARGRDDAKKFWTARLALANAERLNAHQHLASLEAEINVCNDMLNQLREVPKPNGHNPEAA